MKGKASKEAASKEKASKEAASKGKASKEATSNKKPPTQGEGGGFLFCGVLDPHKRIPYMDNKIPYLDFFSHPGGGFLLWGGLLIPSRG